MKKLKSIFAVWLLGLLCVNIALGQVEQNEDSNGQMDIDNAALSTPLTSVNCDGNIEVKPGEEIWQASIQSIIHEKKELVPDAELLERIKAEKAKLRNSNISESADQQIEDGNQNKLVSTPIKGTNFQGNPYNGWYPLDNAIAISDGGIIVSVANSNMYIYNLNGALQYSNSLTNFFGVSSAFDPQVVYDKGSNRFILVCLSGTTSSTSKLKIAFSKTSNPATGGWWGYTLSGNPLNNSCWWDYPKIAVTNGELFVSGNLFNNSNVFNQAVIKQINKVQGYAGASMSSITWYNLTNSPFSILPVGHGQGGSYGNCWFVASQYSGASSVKLYKITNTLNNSPYLGYKGVSVTSYSPASDATQLGTSNLMDVGDCRALNGFILGSTLHFTHNIDKGNGYCGIGYKRINVSTYSSTSLKWSGNSTQDYAYGSVASFSKSSTDQSVMIGMLSASSSYYPHVRVTNCDNSGSWSGSITVKSGNGYVNISSSSTERWGDYTGMSRKHNSTARSIWMNGMFGTTAHKMDTWISEIHAAVANNKEGLSDTLESTPMNVNAFPNPTSDVYNLKFYSKTNSRVKVNLVDAKGQFISTLIEKEIEKGDNLFSLNAIDIKPGVYFVEIIDLNSNKRKTEKLIIN